VVAKRRVLSTRSYLAFMCAAAVSGVIAASKAGTTKPVGRTKPQIPGDLPDTPPVWGPTGATDWVSVHEPSANGKGRPCRWMDSRRVLSPRPLKDAKRVLVQSRRQCACVGETGELQQTI